MKLRQNTVDSHDNEAVDSAGALVLCHNYTYAELQKLDGTIRIRGGQLDCQQPR
jgi:hypothetical protein